MRSLVPLMMILALGGGMAMTAGAPYQLAEQNLEINRTSAAEVLKKAYRQEAMQAATERPALPPGLVVVLPRADGGYDRV